LREEDGVGPLAGECGEGRIDFAAGARIDDLRLRSYGRAGRFHLAPSTSRKVVCVLTVLAGLTSTAIREALGSISRSSSSRFAVNSVFRRLTPVRLALAPREAGDKTVVDRVVRDSEHDGNRRRCILGRECCGEASGCDDHRDLPANQLGR
jgi:hypothetical protein